MIVSFLFCSVKMTDTVNQPDYPFIDIQLLIKCCMLVINSTENKMDIVGKKSKPSLLFSKANIYVLIYGRRRSRLVLVNNFLKTIAA